MGEQPITSPVEGRPSLRPLAFVLSLLAVAWIAALGLIVVQLV